VRLDRATYDELLGYVHHSWGHPWGTFRLHWALDVIACRLRAR
jgi:hypothetical protein